MSSIQGTESALPVTRSGISAATFFAAQVLRAVLFFLAALFAWHQSHLQYDLYLPDEWGLLIYRVTVIVTVLLFAYALTLRYPKPILWPIAAYVLLTGLHGVLDEILLGEGKSLLFLQAIVFAIVMLSIIRDRTTLTLFIGINFVFGFAMILLTTIPVLHWLEVVELPHRLVERFASEQGRFELDPIFFGFFGLTENYVPLGQPFDVARLQGFSLEPIHWSYFVYLTLACALFWSSHVRNTSGRTALWCVLLVVTIHLFFVFSTTAFLAAIGWLATLLFAWFYRRKARPNEARWLMIVVVLVPGFLIPFAVAQIPDIDYILWAEDVLSKGSNWEGKIGFASLGPALYTRFLPVGGEVPSASHNLILGTYLKFGYFLTLPLLAFLLLFFRRAVVGMPGTILAGSLLGVVAHTLVVPPQFFYASGAMWFAISLGVAYHAGSGTRVNRQAAT